MTRKLTNILLVILYTYINVPFYFVGITALHKIAYYGVATIPALIALYNGVVIRTNLSSFFRLFFFYFVTIFFVMIITGSLDFQYLIYFIRLLVGIFSTISMFCIWKKKKIHYMKIEDFEIVYLKSIMFYIEGTMIFIAVPPLKLLWQAIIVDYRSKDFTTVLEYITRFGFAGFSGFSCAFMVSSGVLILCYLYLSNKISDKRYRIYSIIFIIGSFFYGRIGFVVSVFIAGVFSLYLFFTRRPRLLIFYSVIVFMLIGIGFILYFSVSNLRPFIDWLLEPLFNYVKYGYLESPSTNSLKSMYANFHPSDRTLAFGDGYWISITGDGYYGGTDVGFMRNIYYGGIFYCMCLYSLIVLLVFNIYQVLKIKCRSKALLIAGFMLIQFILFEVKGDITLVYLKTYLPFYIYLMHDKKMQRQNIKNEDNICFTLCKC